MVFFFLFFFLLIRRPPRSTQSRSSAASDVYKRQVAELERHLVDGIPFDSDAGLFRLKTPQVLVETHQAFINRWSTQPSRATHSWFIEFDFQRDLPNSECGENIGGAFSTTCVEFSGATRAGVLQQTPSWLLHGTGTLGRLPGAPGPQETGYEPGL